MQCPSCGADASGKFCASCGKPLKTEKCKSCGVAVSPGSRFCTGCGSSLSGGRRTTGSGPGPQGAAPSPTSGSSNLAWWVAGALLVVVLISLGYPVLSRDGSPSGGGVAPAGMGGSTDGGAVDLTTMTLEEQGTILFNRVMGSSSAGDTADVEFFLPKALVIYEQLNPTDPDGIYHYALLHQTGGDFEAALAKAQEGLVQVPDYLLLLAVAAQASAGLGDDARARETYSHFLAVYDAEMGLMRPGYEHHQPIFPEYRSQAQAFLNQG